jgi:maltooligosyltrehalose synthase
LPVVAEGPRARHVVAFARVASDGRAVITVTGRFFAPLVLATPDPGGAAVWDETRLLLPAELAHWPYREVISEADVAADAGRKTELPLGRIFSMLPVAILEPGRP